MLMTLLAACADAPEAIDSAPAYAGGWAEVVCEERDDPARWAVDVETPAPVYLLVLRELTAGPTWIGGISVTWDESAGEYQLLDPTRIDLDCRAWVAQ